MELDCSYSENISINYETIENYVELCDNEGSIYDIINISSYCEIKNFYILKSEFLINDSISKRHKVKGLLKLYFYIEYTEDNLIEQTKILSREFLVNISTLIPEKYNEGESLSILNELIDISTKLITNNKFYISIYLKTTLII